MLLVDLSSVIVQSCINLHKDVEEFDMKTMRSISMFSILNIKKMFKCYGKPIICVDSKPFWRSYVYPHYKMNRKSSREKSIINWEQFHENFNQIKLDIKEYLPYCYIDTPKCECDDIISVLTSQNHESENVLIVSSDKDMIQLQQSYPNVKQFCTRKKQYIKDDGYDLMCHIIKGDAADGIPNIFSEEDVFLRDDIKQVVSSKKRVEEFLNSLNVYPNKVHLKNFKRNQLLIDLSKIPDKIKDRIIKDYQKETEVTKQNKMNSYVIKYRMRNLMNNIKEF